MTHRPTPNKAAPTMLSFLWLMLGIVGYVAGAAAERFSWVFQLLCLVGVTASLYMLLRWRMTWFVFTVGSRDHGDVPTDWEAFPAGMAGCPAEGGPSGGSRTGGAAVNPYRFVAPDTLDFVVVKGQGSRAGIMECVLGMDSLVQAWAVCRREHSSPDLPSYRAKEVRARYPEAKLYEYIQTFLWDTAMVAVFRDGPGYAVLLLDIPPESPLGQYLLTARTGDRDENNY